MTRYLLVGMRICLPHAIIVSERINELFYHIALWLSHQIAMQNTDEVVLITGA